MNEVAYEAHAGVATITLNRGEALNTFTRELRQGVIAAARRAGEDRDVRSVVFTGAGRGFSAGAELRGMAPSAKEAIQQLDEEFNPGILALANMGKPVIAAVEGFVTGIGASYALACDLVLFGESAFLQVPFARIGLIPDGGMCWQLADRVGYRRAFEIAISGEKLTAERCVALGLVNRVVPDGTARENAVAWARQLATAAPLAMAYTKRALRAAADVGLEGTMRAETRMQAECLGSRDFAEGVRAFLEKRAPKFTGD